MNHSLQSNRYPATAQRGDSFRLPDAGYFVAFALFLFLSVIPAFFSVPVSFAAPDPNAAYQRARSAMDRLKADPKRGMQRAPWLRLSDDFLDIYKANPAWANAPAALYRSAAALDELARRSAAARDARAAVERYLRLSDAHPKSVLADDALLRAAKLRLERLKDAAGAAELLDRLLRDFPEGDMVPAARTLRAKIPASPAPPGSPPRAGDAAGMPSRSREPGRAAGRPASATPAVLGQVDWKSRRNLAKVTVTLDRAVPWRVRALKPDVKTGSPARLVIDLPGTKPDAAIKPGARVTGSLLTRLRVDLGTPGSTRVLLDFSALKRFSVVETPHPFSLVITASSSEAALPGGKRPGEEIRSAPDAPDRMRVPADIAAQLGLSLRTVVIDAGHGGSDPGTRHNGVVEKDTALDIARRLGAVLEKRGLQVRYTRQSDVKVPLETRTRFANEAGGDAFVSIHVNAHPTNEAMSGLETYFLDFASSSSAARLAGVENALSDRHLGDLESLLADLMLGARTQESRRLAESVQKFTLSGARKAGFPLRDGGVRSAPFHVLLGSTMPGVLVEVGYCTDKDEAKRLSLPACRAALAEGIANGLLAYSGQLNK